ncbi:MAG: response regulator [Lachnospiraceae bacterium]|nr:response regulator [Lachnospiraceae bacterium]
MDKKCILISKGSTFMVNAVKTNLEGDGFTVYSIGPSIKEINAVQEKADIILFYLGAFVENITEDLVFLKDICVEKEKALCLVGDHEEFRIVRESIPDDIVSKHFERPLDIKALVAGMDDIAEKNTVILRKKSILVVDDDGSFLKMVKGWLDSKYRVTIVSSGMQAITYLAKNKPDLILLDYDMPVTSGPQVLEMIRSEPTTDSLPVIFLTGKGDRESVMKVLSLKPDGYLLKTMGKDELLSAVEKHFEEQKYKAL